MKNVKYVIVSGFFYSGSSAVVDLLKEYEGFYEPGSEMRLITDPYGLIQLERALTDDWNWIRSAMAIEDFKEYAKKCGRKKSYFPLAHFGMGYHDNLNAKYEEITRTYIQQLTEFQFDGDFYAFKAKDKYLIYVINRCRAGVEKIFDGKIKVHKKRLLSYSHPSKEEFYSLTKDYFDNMFDGHGDATIVLDQAIHPRDNKVVNNYFRNSRMIVIDRDPRDIFIDSIINGGITYSNTEQQGLEFCRLQLSQREECKNNEHVKIVRFEDLIINYDETVNEIEEFLQIDSGLHIRKKEFLKPEKSIKNIEIWKKYYNSYNVVIDIIEKQMSNYIYNRG